MHFVSFWNVKTLHSVLVDTNTITSTTTAKTTISKTASTTSADFCSAKNYYVTFTDESIKWDDSFVNPSTALYQQLRGAYENNVTSVTSIFHFQQFLLNLSNDNFLVDGHVSNDKPKCDHWSYSFTKITRFCTTWQWVHRGPRHDYVFETDTARNGKKFHLPCPKWIWNRDPTWSCKCRCDV